MDCAVRLAAYRCATIPLTMESEQAELLLYMCASLTRFSEDSECAMVVLVPCRFEGRHRCMLHMNA